MQDSFIVSIDVLSNTDSDEALQELLRNVQAKLFLQKFAAELYGSLWKARQCRLDKSSKTDIDDVQWGAYGR